MRLYYNSATPPAETWVRVSAIVGFPSVSSRANMYGIATVVLRDFEGALYSTWQPRDYTEMKVTDDYVIPNTLFRGYLINKKFQDRELILEIAGIGEILERKSFGNEEEVNYILAEGKVDTCNASSIIDVYKDDNDNDVVDGGEAFTWGVNYWTSDLRNVGLMIVDNTAGYSSKTWDSSLTTPTGEEASGGNNASTLSFNDSDYYWGRDTSTAATLSIAHTIDGAVIDDANYLKTIELRYSWRGKIQGAAATWAKVRIVLEILKDTTWIEIDRLELSRYGATSHTSGWITALPDTIDGGTKAPYIISDTNAELLKFFNTDGAGDYDELKGLRFRMLKRGGVGLPGASYAEIHVDYFSVIISYSANDVEPIMEKVTANAATTLTCASVANWQNTGVTNKEDAFQIGQNTLAIIDDISSEAGIEIYVVNSAAFTKYMARIFKGKHCLDALEAVCKVEGAHWVEDYINDRIKVLKPADYEASGTDLTESNYSHNWQYEDICNQVRGVYVWGKSSYNNTTKTTINIFAKAIDDSIKGGRTVQIIDDNITNVPDAQAIADAQLALLKTKRPSIRVPLRGQYTEFQLGTYVNLTMARPTVAAADYRIRMIEISRLGKTGIITILHCGLGETEWDEKYFKAIRKIQSEIHRISSEALTSSPYETGSGGIVSAVEAVITAELVDGQSIDNRIDTLIAAASSCKIATGTYTGNGNNNRQITGLGFTPKFLNIYQHQAAAVMYTFVNHDDFGAWDTLRVSGETFYDDGNISTIIADGFEVNNGEATDWANINGMTYYWVAWG